MHTGFCDCRCKHGRQVTAVATANDVSPGARCDAGLTVGAWTKSAAAGDLCEMVELPQHPWFFGCQFHPEFTSNPRRGHPLFVSFIRAALERMRHPARAKEGSLAELVASD